MKTLIKKLLAHLLQFLIRQPIIRTAGQRIVQRMPRTKRLLLQLLYSMQRHPTPEAVEHMGRQEVRLNNALAQRIKGRS